MSLCLPEHSPAARCASRRTNCTQDDPEAPLSTVLQNGAFAEIPKTFTKQGISLQSSFAARNAKRWISSVTTRRKIMTPGVSMLIQNCFCPTRSQT